MCYIFKKIGFMFEALWLKRCPLEHILLQYVSLYLQYISKIHNLFILNPMDLKFRGYTLL